MIISAYDCWKRKGLSRRRKLESVGAETTSSGSPFQIRGPETLKVWLPTVDRLSYYSVFAADTLLNAVALYRLIDSWSFYILVCFDN